MQCGESITLVTCCSTQLYATSIDSYMIINAKVYHAWVDHLAKLYAVSLQTVLQYLLENQIHYEFKDSSQGE